MQERTETGYVGMNREGKFLEITQYEGRKYGAKWGDLDRATVFSDAKEANRYTGEEMVKAGQETMAYVPVRASFSREVLVTGVSVKHLPTGR